MELAGWGSEDWLKPSSCLAKVCGLEGLMCVGIDCIKTLARQHNQQMIMFGNIVMKKRTKTELA